jgi:L-ascorbate metabolism protein UlaG (beta-lactamase superfamily)
MKLTWFDANTWLIEAGGLRILIDPWLVGDLVFGNMPWFVRGWRANNIEIPPQIDLILLSQGLPDHAHVPTLEQLDKSIPVAASVDGAAVARRLGYESVTTLAHGDDWHFEGNTPGASSSGLKVQTFIGAVVGATKRENGYVLTFLESGLRLYYEPHGYPDAQHLKDVGSVDVVITPMADIRLMGIAPVIRGQVAAPQVAQLLKPKVMLPTAEDGQVTYEGLIAPALTTSGGAAALRSQLQALGIQVIQPVSGQPIELNLQATV